MWNVKTWIALVWLVGVLVSIPSTVFGVSEHEEGTPTEESSTEIREAARQKIVETKPPISALIQISKGLADTEMTKAAFTKLVDRTQGLEKKQRDAIIGSFQEVSTRLGSTGRKKLREEFSQAVNGALTDLEKSLSEPPAKVQSEQANGKNSPGNPLDPKAPNGQQNDLSKVLEKLLAQAEDPSLRGREAQRELLRSLLAQNAAKNGKGEGGGNGGAPGGGNGKAGGAGDPQGGGPGKNNGADRLAKAIEKAGHDDKNQKEQPERKSSSNSNDNNSNNNEKKSGSETARNQESNRDSGSSREALSSLLDEKDDKSKEEPKKKEKPDMDKLLGLNDKSKGEEAPAKSIPSFLLGGKEALSPAPPNQSLAFSAPEQTGGQGGGGGSSDLAGAKTASAQNTGAAVSGDPPPLQEPNYGPQVAAGTVFERSGIYQNAGSSGGGGGTLDDDGDGNSVDSLIPEKLKASGPAPRTVVVRESSPLRGRSRDRALVRKGNILEQNKGNLVVEMCGANPSNPFCLGNVTPFEERLPSSNSRLGGLPS